MKQALLSILLFFLPMLASADPLEINGIYYNLITNDKIAVVTSNPNHYFGDIVIPESVEYEGMTFIVTSLGNRAFFGCNSLSSLTLPKTLSSIGNYAFSGCSELVNIYLPRRNIPTTNSETFTDAYIEYATLHVPEFAIGSYSNSVPWSGFGHIVALTDEEFEYNTNTNMYIYDNDECVINTENGTVVNAGFIWGEIKNAITISNPFEVLYYISNYNTEVKIDDQTVSIPYFIYGNTNPKDQDGNNPATSLNVPVMGSAVKIDAHKNGWVYILFINASSNKQYTVFEDQKAIGYTFAALGNADSGLGDVYRFTLTGDAEHNYLEEAGYTELEWAVKEYLKVADPELYELYSNNGGWPSFSSLGVIKFAVNKNSEYIINGCSSKIKWGAVYFSETDTETITYKNDKGETITLLDPINNGIYHKLAITSDNHGTVTYNGADVKAKTMTFGVQEGTNATLTFTPAIGCALTGLTVNGVDKLADVSEGSLTISNVTANTTVVATFTYAGVTATVTISSVGQGTYCYNQDLDFTDVDGIKAYVASGFNPSNGNILLMRVKEVPAGTGLLVKGDVGTYTIPVKDTQFYYLNMFKPVFEATTVATEEDGNTNYVLANGSEGLKFYKSSGASLAANRAYLQIPTSILGNHSNARSIGYTFDDEEGTTAINSINEETDEGILYNLNGQRVTTPRKGIYVRNGKKVFVNK